MEPDYVPCPGIFCELGAEEVQLFADDRFVLQDRSSREPRQLSVMDVS
jgi:hypothetical protein